MRKTALVVSIILAVILLTKGAYASSFSPATKVNRDESTAFQVTPRVSFDQNARPICIWRDDRGSMYNIYGSIKTSNGWEEETAVSDSIIDYRGSPDISGPVACWTDHRSGYHLYSSLWDGTGWGANVSVNPSASYGYNPSVASNPNGKSAAAWMAPGHGWDIFYAEWDGSTWSAIEPVTSSEQTEWYPTLAFLGEKPFVVWSQPSVGNVLLYAHKDGDAWSAAKEIPTGGWPISNAHTPTLVSNQQNDKLIVLWRDYRVVNEVIYYAEYDPVSDSFINDGPIPNPVSNVNGGPRGAFDSDGNLWVVWEEYKSGEGEQIYYTKRDPSGNWSEISPVSPSEYAQQNPDIDSQGKRVVVVWEQDSLSTGRDVYASELSSSPPPREPILIVPGMTASWSEDLFLNLGIFRWQLVPTLGTRVYEGLTRTLEEQGFVVETLGYDWRRPHNEIVAGFLKPEIDILKASSPTGKVDIVAHSQGGIVSRAYIQSPDYEDDVDTLITVGSPHKGTPKTYYLWEGALAPTNYRPVMQDILNFFLNLYYLEELGKLSRVEVTQKYFPSAKEILPVSDFLRNEEGNLIDFASLSVVNNFLLDLNSRGSELAKIRFINLVGTGYDTTNILKVREHQPGDGDYWADGFPIGEEYSVGDGTVSYQSAASEFANEVHELNLNHSQLITETESIKKICELLGTQATEYFSGGIAEDYTQFVVHSPATLLVTSPSGKSIGFDPNTQTYINEFENADILGENESFKWIIISNPENGNYLVKVIGTGSGIYHLTTMVENANTSARLELQGETVEGEQTSINQIIDTEDPGESLIVDPTGEIHEQSALTKLSGIGKICKINGHSWLSKRTEKITELVNKGKIHQAIHMAYIARKEISLKISEKNQRVYYKNLLEEVSQDLTETYATNAASNRKKAEKKIKLAELLLSKAWKVLGSSVTGEVKEILDLAEEKLSTAKKALEDLNYSKSEILAEQSCWLVAEALIMKI